MNLIRHSTVMWLFWPMLLFLVSLLLRFCQISLFQDALSEADSQAIRHVSTAAIIYSLAWLLSRAVSLALARKGTGKRKTPRLLGELLTAALFTVATVVAVGLLLGQNTGGILASSGLIIAILGFAIRNVLADVLSGIAIGLEAPYRIGDWVEFDSETSGRVVEIGWRTTRVLSTNGTYMILPNSHISRQMLTNYSAPRKHYQASLQIVLGHDIPVSKAKEVLLNAAIAASRPISAAESQKPVVRAASYDAEGILYTIKYWVPSYADDIDCRDAVLVAIDDALREKGLSSGVGRIKVVAVKQPLVPADEMGAS